MMRDPLTVPVLRVSFVMPDDSVYTRDWAMDDDMPKLLEAPPPWLTNPKREWSHPQDPITFTGVILLEHEAEARAALALNIDGEAA